MAPPPMASPRARHLVVYLHGIAPTPGPEEATCGRILRQFHADLTTRLGRLEPIIIHWGHATAHRHSPDTRLSAAEHFLYLATHADRHRQRPDVGIVPGATWLVRQRLVRPLRQMLVEGLGDLVYYTAPEGERALREALYQQLFAAPAWRQALARQAPVQLSVIAHSAGAVLAFDLLYTLFRPAARRGPRVIRETPDGGLTARRIEQARTRVLAGTVTLQAVVTLGSFLPIFFLRRQFLVDRLARGRRLDAAVIGLKGQGRWLNVWDYDDLVAFPIAGLFRDPERRIRDLQVDTGDWMASAHVGYWRHPAVLDAVAEALLTSP